MYGEVTSALHGAMTQLLEMRRPSFFLGGANGNRPATTTPEEGAAATAKVLRYRKAIWDYALDLAEAATPIYAVDGWEAHPDACSTGGARPGRAARAPSRVR